MSCLAIHYVVWTDRLVVLILQTEVNATQISGNLDSPEGGFDAIMQAIVCDVGTNVPLEIITNYSYPLYDRTCYNGPSNTTS